jgi:PhnB protein
MQLSPYLAFNGTCEAALNFYKDIFNGEIVEFMRFGDSPMEISDDAKNRVMHATLNFGSNSFMASDSMPGQDAPDCSNITMSLGTNDLEATNKTFAALSEGGQINMPLEDTFWGARFGMLTDKFGINWMINCELPKTE